MLTRKALCFGLAMVTARLLVACGQGEEDETCQPATPIQVPADYNPTIDPARFSTAINHPYLPLVPGTTFVYEGADEDGVAIRNETAVTSDAKVVMGVGCVVVRDRVEVGGQLEEETLDWYAQDSDGNVWYLGEDSKEYSGGAVTSTAGSWEAGVNGALPGIVMLAAPQVGDAYRQEYLRGTAEDMAEVIAVGESVTVPQGTYTDTVVTREWTPLESCLSENKYYARGVGLVRALSTAGDLEEIKLTSLTTP